MSLLAEVLGDDVEVQPNSDFFVDLNGSSLDYFTFTYKVKDQFELDDDFFQGKGLTTVREFANAIMDNLQ